MKHILAAAVLAVVTNGAVVPPAMAHDGYSHVKNVHIERQCDRYDNFCGKSEKVVKQRTKAKRRVSIAKYPYRWYEEKPFIERQCTRYGNFC